MMGVLATGIVHRKALKSLGFEDNIITDTFALEAEKQLIMRWQKP